MISGKTQIIRQKKIELCNLNMPKVSLTEPDRSSHSSLSPSSLPDGDLHSQLESRNENAEISTSHSINFDKKYKTDINSSDKEKPINSNSKALTTIINNGSKLQISSALRDRLRRSKSPNPKKPITSNNSMPSADNKLSKLTNFSNRLSNQAGSFFSKSCQGEELTSEICKKDLDGIKSNNRSGTSSVNTSTSNLNSIKMRSFLAFGRSGQKSNSQCKSFSKNSVGFNSLSVDENDSLNSNSSSPMFSKQSSLSSYDVDLEKLARELILPSLDQPLTSFSDPNTKPMLQSCKTMDNYSVDNYIDKKKIARANTEKH